MRSRGRKGSTEISSSPQMSLMVITPQQTRATAEASWRRAFHYVSSDVKSKNMLDHEVTDTCRMRQRAEC